MLPPLPWKPQRSLGQVVPIAVSYSTHSTSSKQRSSNRPSAGSKDAKTTGLFPKLARNGSYFPRFFFSQLDHQHHATYAWTDS